ncbi:MAG: cyclic nucleotide-binding domain-containing protein, partial [Candidatus Omnitrophica bacterium]|nr:cyclic nucleotide-binding domain-containing protein [Candidatus Omnitrophota bacterium]
MPTPSRNLSAETLSQFRLFETVPIDRLNDLQDSIEVMEFPKGHRVCEQGTEGNSLFLVHSGEVRVIRKDPDGNLETLGNLGPGDYFGEISVLTGDPMSADVVATTDIEVYIVNGEKVRELCAENPLLSMTMVKAMSVRLLRNVPVFESCPDDLLCEVMESVKEKIFDRGELICEQGAQGGIIYLIKSGQVRVALGDGGDREETLGYLGPGDHFGEMSVLTGEPISANVIATMRTRVFALQGEEFERICEKNPILYKGISRTLSIRLREANQRKILKNLGRLTRVCPDQPESDPSVLTSTMAGIANEIWRQTHTRQLCLLPLPAEDVGNEDSIREIARIPQRIQISFGLESASEDQKQAILFEVAGCLGKTTHEWYRVGHVDLLTLSKPEVGEEMQWEHRVEETISLMKPLYSQILFMENVCSARTVLEECLPEEAVVVLVDLTDSKWQEEASHQDLQRWIPEGARYPHDREEKHWVLSAFGEERLRLLGKTLDDFPEKAVQIVIIHDPEKPILDYSRTRRLLKGATVNLLPFEEKWYRRGQPQEPKGNYPSLAILRGKNPRHARSFVGREISGNRIGLALGGGGARGMAHVGVIKVLL